MPTDRIDPAEVERVASEWEQLALVAETTFEEWLLKDGASLLRALLAERDEARRLAELWRAGVNCLKYMEPPTEEMRATPSRFPWERPTEEGK